MKQSNTPHRVDKLILATLLFSLSQYPQALSQNLGNNTITGATLIIPYNGNALPPLDTVKITVQPGSAKGFMALLRDLGMTDERTILKVGTALQTALEEHFPNYNKIIVPGSILTYVTTPLKVINVAFPNGGAITATISGGSTNPQVIIKVDKTATQTNQADTQSELTPRMYSAPTTNAVASIEKQRGTPVSIANTGVVGALRQTIVSDHHELPVESIANQAGGFIYTDLSNKLGNETLPNNLTIQTIRDNQIGGLRVYVTQKTVKVEKVETGTFKTTNSGKKIPVHKTIRTPISTKIAEYGITNESTKVHTYSIDITD